MIFTKRSPMTGEKLQDYKLAEPAEILLALSSLSQVGAYWRKLPPRQRQENLRPALKNLKEKKDLFAQAITQEMGKPIKQAIAEVDKCIKTFEACLDMSLDFLTPQLTKSIYSESCIVREPMGVIYSIMPWNFPLWQAVRMIVPVLLSGNTILLKHSEVTPEMGKMIGHLFDFEKGPLLQHVFASHDSTELILSDERVRGFSLTGSTNAGLKIAAVAVKYLKKYVLELGGSDPYIVFHDADLALSAKMIAQSRLQNTGQSCIAAKRCLVDERVREEFTALLKAEFDHFQFGALSDPKTTLGPLADIRFKKSHHEQIDELIKQTGAVQTYQKKAPRDEHSAYVDVEIYELPKNSSWLRDQEFFSPVLLLIPFSDEAEALAIANSTIFGLGAGLFSKDLGRAKEFARGLQAGQVSINDFIKSDLSLPFGGVKMSGTGRELSQQGFLEFTELKAISHS